jgi:hypothetical protein
LKTDAAMKVNLAKILVLRAEDAKVTNMWGYLITFFN